MYEEIPPQDSDISFVSSGRPSVDHIFPSYHDTVDVGKTPRMSNASNVEYRSYEMPNSTRMSMDVSAMDLTSTPPANDGDSYTSQAVRKTLGSLYLDSFKKMYLIIIWNLIRRMI